jgi:hypothetical protein
MISELHRQRFELAHVMGAAGNLALVEATEKATGKPCSVLCAYIPAEGGGMTFYPIAKMIEAAEFEAPEGAEMCSPGGAK